MSEHSAENDPAARALWALVQIGALLPNECWMTRSALVRCTDAIGGTFPNGTEFTEDMCCLPCRVRAVLTAVTPGGPMAKRDDIVTHNADFDAPVTFTLSSGDFEAVLNGLGSALDELEGLRLPESVAYRDDLNRVVRSLREQAQRVIPPEEGKS